MANRTVASVASRSREVVPNRSPPVKGWSADGQVWPPPMTRWYTATTPSASRQLSVRTVVPSSATGSDSATSRERARAGGREEGLDGLLRRQRRCRVAGRAVPQCRGCPHRWGGSDRPTRRSAAAASAGRSHQGVARELPGDRDHRADVARARPGVAHRHAGAVGETDDHDGCVADEVMAAGCGNDLVESPQVLVTGGTGRRDERVVAPAAVERVGEHDGHALTAARRSSPVASRISSADDPRPWRATNSGCSAPMSDVQITYRRPVASPLTHVGNPSGAASVGRPHRGVDGGRHGRRRSHRGRSGRRRPDGGHRGRHGRSFGVDVAGGVTPRRQQNDCNGPPAAAVTSAKRLLHRTTGPARLRSSHVPNGT